MPSRSVFNNITISIMFRHCQVERRLSMSVLYVLVCPGAVEAVCISNRPLHAENGVLLYLSTAVE
jgi:hypothetical protein